MNMKKNLFSQCDELDRGDLLTEIDNPKSKYLDRISTTELVNIFLEEDKIPQLAVSKAKNDIVKTIDLISKCLTNDNARLFYIGAGTSGRLAVLDAAECPPTFCTSPEKVQALIAGGYSSLVSSSEDIEDSYDLSIIDLKKRNFSSIDCLVGITAGGTTPYVLSALNYAKSVAAINVVITCVPESQKSFDTDVAIRLLTGPEIISGSTRLKAGTATKMALNMISTGVMTKLGKVFGNKMVDLSIKNSKLLDRSLRILCDLLTINRIEAINLLESSGGSIKISCIMKLSGLNIADSTLLLKDNNNQLYKALKALNLHDKLL